MTTPDEAMLTEWECDIRDALADIDGKRWICANDALNALIEHVRAGHSANAERVSVLEAENARLRKALARYANNKSWHWTGEVWSWNGDGSAHYTGTKAKASAYPDQEDVDRECGSIARAALGDAS
jgi:hypothetical protein